MSAEKIYSQKWTPQKNRLHVHLQGSQLAGVNYMSYWVSKNSNWNSLLSSMLKLEKKKEKKMKRSIQYNSSILLPSKQVTLVLLKNIPSAKRYIVNSVRTQASVNKWKIQFSLLKVFVSASERASTGMFEYIVWQGGKKANRKKSDCKYASVLQQRVSVLEPT